MADMIRPVDISGTVQRSQDITSIKQNEDNKPALDQQNIQYSFNKNIERSQQQIIKKEDAMFHQEKYDAKEKGRGQEYERQTHKRKKEKKEDKVIKLSQNNHFDMKI